MTNITPRIEAIHATYNRLTESQLTLTFDRIYWWECWLAKGFTESDLALVVGHIQKGIKDGTRHRGALRWSHLIQEPEHFEEELSLARAEARNAKPPPTPKERVLAQAGRPVAASEKDTAQSAGQVMATSDGLKRLFEQMRKAAE